MGCGCVLAALRPHRSPGQPSPPPGLLSVSSPRSGGRRTVSPGEGWISASTLSCLFWQLILSHISSRITCPVLPPERAQAICRRHLPLGGVDRSGLRPPLPPGPVGRNDGRAAPVCSRAIIPQRVTVHTSLPLTLSLFYSRAEKRALSAGLPLTAPLRRCGLAFSSSRHSMRPYGSGKRSHGGDDVVPPPNPTSARLQPCGGGLPSCLARRLSC